MNTTEIEWGITLTVLYSIKRQTFLSSLLWACLHMTNDIINELF